MSGTVHIVSFFEDNINKTDINAGKMKKKHLFSYATLKIMLKSMTIMVKLSYKKQQT